MCKTKTELYILKKIQSTFFYIHISMYIFVLYEFVFVRSDVTKKRRGRERKKEEGNKQ